MNGLWDWVLHRRIGVGLVLFTLGLSASGWLAFAASAESPPTGSQSALLVILGGLFNLGGAWLVSRRPGGPNLTAARIVVRHLAAIGERVVDVRTMAEVAFDSRPGGKAREDIGVISVKLSEVEDRLIANLEDWTRAYPDLLDRETANRMSEAKGEES
ncbi:hypothetical protein ACIPV2_00170 [Microbacterium sp. NPDC089987]|uniref:hypothetical protein n=1 Tax=Microbacterium sp. NPDC089987 TaxID=3364202 RepID=UPI00381FA4E5